MVVAGVSPATGDCKGGGIAGSNLSQFLNHMDSLSSSPWLPGLRPPSRARAGETPAPSMVGAGVSPAPSMVGAGVPPAPSMVGAVVPPAPSMAGAGVPPAPSMAGAVVPPAPSMVGAGVSPAPYTDTEDEAPQRYSSLGFVPRSCPTSWRPDCLPPSHAGETRWAGETPAPTTDGEKTCPEGILLVATAVPRAMPIPPKAMQDHPKAAPLVGAGVPPAPNRNTPSRGKA